MLGLSRIMPALLRALLEGARHQVRRYCLHILLVAVAALIAMMALAMLVGGAFLSLADSMPAPAAAAVTGGGLLAAAALIALIAPRLSRGRSRRPAAAATHESTGGSISALADHLEAAAAAIGRDGRSEAPGFAVMALLAGCAIGASPELRRVIAHLLR